MNSSASKSVTILIVEDDMVDVEILKHGLEKAGIFNNIRHAETGIKALEMLRGENGHVKMPSPYVMLVDINMPMMNGFEMLCEVRADHVLKSAVAFMLTTSARSQDKSEAYRLNVAGYFLKENLDILIKTLIPYCQGNEFPVSA